MPRGKYVNHKGRSRHFTSPDELERERKKELDKKWRKKKDEDDDEESSEEEEAGPETGDGAAGPSVKKSESASGSEESESESEDDENKKKKGVEGLIEIENPNRIVKKVKKPTAKVEDDGPKEGPTPNRASSSSVKPELSRREREELEKQRARAHYQKLHAEGKTEEARADLARLALIRKQREEAAKKREDEKKAKDAATAAKHEQVNKALGKKS